MFLIMLNHPSDAHTREWKGLREIVNYSGMRQTGCRLCRLSMVNRMIYLVADELDSTRGGELVQALQLGIGDGRPGRSVRTVDENQLRITVSEPLDLFHIDLEFILSSDRVIASLNSKRFGQGGKRGVARLWQDNVGLGLGRQPHEHQQGFGSAGHDLHAFCGYALHFSNSGAQYLRTCRTAVNQFVIEEPFSFLVTAKAQNFIHSPAWSLASAQVELNVVLVPVEPHI